MWYIQINILMTHLLRIMLEPVIVFAGLEFMQVLI